MASRIATSTALAAAALFATSVARADPTPLERSLAQSLFDEARNAMDAGHLDEACEKFGRSQKLDPGGGTVLNLAVCHEKQGKVATAWSEFNEAFSAAVRDNRQDRAAFAREMIDKLKARLPHLVITIAAQQVPYLEVRVDGVTLPPAAIGVPAPLDPGPHLIEAGAYLRTPFHASVELAEGESKTLEVPVLQFVPGVAPPTPTCPEGRELKGDRCVEKPRTSEPDAPRKLSSASWIFGGVGAASLVAFGVTGALALAAHGDANKVCNLDRNYCATDDGYSAASRARTFAWVSTVTLGVGVASGFTAWLLPRDRVAKKPLSLRVGPFGGAIAGEF